MAAGGAHPRCTCDGRGVACALHCLPWLLCILGTFLLVLPKTVSAQQPGFVSVSCGSQVAYVDPVTGISYEADNYISTGSTSTVTSEFRDSVLLYLNTLRYFPPDTTPKKNCYNLTVDANTQYLVRAIFFHGGYNSQTTGSVSFQLALDASFWTETSVDAAQHFYEVEEAIVMTKKTSLTVCLIRTSDDISGVPLINSLELRPLPSTMYLGRYAFPSDYLLYKLRRRNYGESVDDTRYPSDQYDRYWYRFNSTAADPSYTDVAATALTQTFTPASSTFNYDTPPDNVLRTAMTAPTLINWTASFNASLYSELYISVFFAEILSTAELAGRSRILDISGNFIDSISLQISVLPFVYLQLVAFPPVSTASSSINLQVAKNISSDLPPIVNALEVYSKQDVSPGTDAAQVATLDNIKAELGRDVWSGDPCLPVSWIGLNCTRNQVTSINLSNQNLTGLIPDFSGLTSLVSLDLSNNQLSGALPDWVAALPSLRTLDVSNNQLTGTFPSSYTQRIPGFRYSNNLQLTCVPAGGVPCPASPPGQPVTPPTPSPPATPSTPRGLTPPPTPAQTSPAASKSKESSLGPIIGAVAGGILLIALIVAAVLLYCCWYKPKRESNGNIPQPQSPLNISLAASSTMGTPVHVAAMRGKAQPFTLQSIKEATNNFARKIGEGGFGPVYYGMFTTQEVAVKVMSGKTHQGFSEFSNEIDLLSTVHYKKLVSLVGYCQEGSDLILLYEYMSGGDLRQRLYGPNALHSPLNWRQRLHIAVDAARGLEYLHNGCSPAIFHRDVKSSNILLTEKLEAKVADFGLSKLTNAEQTQVMTMVKGTLGYLDPEYNSTGMVTDKSDVYSFGIVLLEILVGQAPIVKEGFHSKFIVDKVRVAMKTGSLEAVIDPRLRGDYRAESAWKLAEVAMSCVERSGASRPGMSKVVAELAEVLEMEFGRQESKKRDGVSGDSDLFTSGMSSGPAPYNYNNSNYSAGYSETSSLPPEAPSQIFHQDVHPHAR